MKWIPLLLLISSVSNVQFCSTTNHNLTALRLSSFTHSIKDENDGSRGRGSSMLTEIMVTMIKRCTQGNPTVLFHEDPLDDAIRTLMTWKAVNVILHHEFHANRPDYRYNNVHPFDRIDILALIITDSRQFQKSLNLLIWIKSWNVEIPTFIVNQNATSCANATDHFNVTWRLNFLAPYYICIDSDNNRTIYTHSPYASRAPPPWKVVEEFSKLEGRVFKRIYDEDDICSNLYFDRTRNVAGHSVNIVKIYQNIPTGVSGYYEKFENALKSTLNASFSNYNEIILNPSKFGKLLTNKTIDLVFQITQLPSDDKLKLTYPVIYSNDYILTHSKGLINPIDIIFTFYNYLTIVLTIVFWLIFKVVFTINSQVEIHLMPKQTKMRHENFFFVTWGNFSFLPTTFITFLMFVQFWMIYVSFCGDLTKSFTYPQLKKYREYFEESEVNSHFQVFTNLAGSREVDNIEANSRYIVNQYESCIYDVAKETLSACIDDCIIASNATLPRHLYVSKSVNSMRPYYFIRRHDWPLYRRVDEILMVLEQAGISKVWYDQFISITRKQKHFQSKYSSKLKLKYKSININTLTLAFGTLAVGLGFSLFSFIFEVIINNRNKKIQILDELMYDEIEDLQGISCDVDRLLFKHC